VCAELDIFVCSYIIVFNVAGIGKGLLGIVTRPASGIVDFASTSFEGIRR
jgi:hypothetical protein